MIPNFKIGQVVCSMAGRDQEDYFLVVHMDKEYVYLVDGKGRSLEKPKKKKYKHIKPTKIIINSIAEKLLKNEKVTNAEVRKQLNIIIKNNELND